MNSKGIIEIIMLDGGTRSAGAPSPSRGFEPAPAGPSLPRPVMAPAPSPRSSPAASKEEQIRAILDDRGLKKSLGNPTAEELGKNATDFIKALYEQVVANPKAAPFEQTTPASGSKAAPESPPPAKSPAGDDWYQRFHELQNRQDMGGKMREEEVAELKNLTAALHDFTANLKAPTPPVGTPPSAPILSGGFGLKPRTESESAWDAVQANGGKKPWWGPPAEQPKLPRAEPVDPARKANEGFGLKTPAEPPKRPRAEVVSDAEKSRELWTPAGALKDLKGYLPAGIGNKMDAVGGAYKAASGAAAEAGAGRMGAMAAGVGEAAVAAGPAAALLALELATKAVVGGMGKLQHGIEATGATLGQLAGGDGAGAAKAAFDGVTGAMDDLGPPLRILSAEMKLAAAPIRAMGDVASAFVKRGKELQAFSGALTAANVTADIRSLKADIRESQKLGKDIARMTDAESRSGIALREIALPIRQGLAKVAAGIEERVATILERLVPFVERMADVADFWYRNGPKQAVEFADKAEQGWKNLYDEVAKLVGLAKKKEDKDAANSLLEELKHITDDLKRNPNAPKQPPPPKGPFGLQFQPPKNW